MRRSSRRPACKGHRDHCKGLEISSGPWTKGRAETSRPFAGEQTIKTEALTFARPATSAEGAILTRVRTASRRPPALFSDATRSAFFTIFLGRPLRVAISLNLVPANFFAAAHILIVRTFASTLSYRRPSRKAHLAISTARSAHRSTSISSMTSASFHVSPSMACRSGLGRPQSLRGALSRHRSGGSAGRPPPRVHRRPRPSWGPDGVWRLPPDLSGSRAGCSRRRPPGLSDDEAEFL